MGERDAHLGDWVGLFVEAKPAKRIRMLKANLLTLGELGVPGFNCIFNVKVRDFVAGGAHLGVTLRQVVFRVFNAVLHLEEI